MEEYDILQCVDRALSQFGPSVKQSVYWHISILHGSLHNGVISHPRILSSVLRRIFGDSAVGIETSIIRELASIFDLRKGDAEDLTLALKSASEQIIPTHESLQAISAK